HPRQRTVRQRRARPPTGRRWRLVRARGDADGRPAARHLRPARNGDAPVSAIVSLLVAVDPLGLARTWPKRLETVGIAAVLLVVAALVADPVLDALDLSAEGFWIAAGIVLLVPATSRLGQGLTHDVAGPAAVLVTMALATRDGLTVTLVAIAVTAVLTALASMFLD